MIVESDFSSHEGNNAKITEIKSLPEKAKDQCWAPSHAIPPSQQSFKRVSATQGAYSAVRREKGFLKKNEYLQIDPKTVSSGVWLLDTNYCAREGP